MSSVVRANELPNQRWLVVNTHSKCEQLALDNLERQEFLVYCPWIRKRIKHARRVHDTLRPLFPGYLFVAFDPAEQRWRPLLSTRGVRSVVRCGDQPSFIGDDFITKLRAREVEGAITQPANPYRIGQQVRIANGALDGLIATIVGMDEKARLVVLLNLLNRPVRTNLSANQVAETTGA